MFPSETDVFAKDDNDVVVRPEGKPKYLNEVQ